jgi:hypothetical protein
MTAMAPKRIGGQWSTLVSMDFLAGPGRGVMPTRNEEFDGWCPDCGVEIAAQLPVIQ